MQTNQNSQLNTVDSHMDDLSSLEQESSHSSNIIKLVLFGIAGAVAANLLILNLGMMPDSRMPILFLIAPYKYIFLFGVLIALAYRFNATALNIRNIVLYTLCGAIIVLLSGFIVFPYLNRWVVTMIINSEIRFGDEVLLLMKTGVSFLILMLQLLIAYSIFYITHKPSKTKTKTSQKINPLIPRLAYTFMLSGLICSLSIPYIQTSNMQFLIMIWPELASNMSITAIFAVLVICTIQFFLFVLLTYLIVRGFYPDATPKPEPKVIAYVLGSFAFFILVSLASCAATIYILQSIRSQPPSVNGLMLLAAFVLYCWIGFRSQSLAVAFLLIGGLLLQFLGIEILGLSNTGYRNSAAIFYLYVFILLTSVLMLIYSFAIQFGIRCIFTHSTP